jgi:hypothetical protein
MRSRLEVATRQIVVATAGVGWEPEQPTRF